LGFKKNIQASSSPQRRRGFEEAPRNITFIAFVPSWILLYKKIYIFHKTVIVSYFFINNFFINST